MWERAPPAAQLRNYNAYLMARDAWIRLRPLTIVNWCTEGVGPSWVNGQLASGDAAEPSRGSVARLTTLTDLDMDTAVKERVRLWDALYTMELATYQAMQ